MKLRFLLAPVLALCVLAARPPRQGLPPIPAVVFSRGGPISVKLVKVVDCPMGPERVTPPNVIGCYSAIPHIIQIADTLSAEWQTFVLAHELVHVAARDDGLPYAGILEEAYATAWGRYRLAELLAAQP